MLSGRIQAFALVVFASMLVVSVVYTVGPFHLSQRAVGQRITQACRTMDGALMHTAPADITARDLSRLAGAASAASIQVAAILPDARQSDRRAIRELSSDLEVTSIITVGNQVGATAHYLAHADTLARRFGGSCPPAISAGQATSLEALARERLRARRLKAAKP